MEKVNWRKQYMLDCIFNIAITILIAVLTHLKCYSAVYLFLFWALFVNIAAFGFFNKKRFE